MRRLSDSVLIRETASGDLELGVDVGGGDEAVVADLDEARWQDVKQNLRTNSTPSTEVVFPCLMRKQTSRPSKLTSR
jgi:hypothetical protein